MKNILEIIKEYGLEVSTDKVKDFEKAVLENYKTVADYNAQKEKLDSAEGKLEEVDNKLKDFEANKEDVNTLNLKITELQDSLNAKETEYQNKLSERVFEDILKDGISKANGINEKAIKALLDIESLKGSKNQKEDVTNAIKSLVEAEDSKMLFKEDVADVVGKGDLIGKVTSKGGTELSGVEKAFMERNPDLKI